MNPFEGYRVTSPFGWRNHPISKERAFHTGIDLVIGHQSPIYAFVEGEVLFASEGLAGTGFGGYGNVVAIKDKNGHLHVYAHLDSIVLKVGARVEKGQMIGRQGNTGKSTGSHLHYEVRKTCSPSYGWVADRANNCFEPTQYLTDFSKEDVRVEEKVNHCIVVLPSGEKVTGILYEGSSYMKVKDYATEEYRSINWDDKTNTVVVK